MPNFEIVLFNPEIPPNTGNIMRLCSNTNSSLHIIKPIGFDMSEKSLRRAGLDYIKNIKIFLYQDSNDFFSRNNFSRYFLISKFGKINYANMNYKLGDCFIFGSESRGLSNLVLNEDKYFNKIFIPMANENRSLNLANTVSIVIYEALRQNNFQFL